MKICSRCKQNLEDDAFTRSPTTGKLASYCKSCQHEYDMSRKRKTNKKDYYKQNRDKILAYHREYDSRPEVIEKKKAYNKEYYSRSDIIERRKAYNIKYNEQNRDKIAERKALYREQNRDRINTAQRLWYKNNKEKYLNWVNRIDRKIGNAISKSIYHTLKGNKSNRHWEDLVSYTLEDLMKHLESQFDENMNWDNYGLSSQKLPTDYYWEIDHIIPVNTFNFDNSVSPEDHDFKICWSLMNLRPLEWRANAKRPKDGSDIPEELKQQILNQDI